MNDMNKIKTELEKCLNGEIFNCVDNELTQIISNARTLTAMYNRMSHGDAAAGEAVLRRLFCRMGSNVKIDRPFYCDYGRNISIGDNVIINISCIFVDCNKISIGNNVLIASNVQIYTAAHPVGEDERLVRGWSPDSPHAFFNTYALPVTIEDNVWIGGGAVILPGVTVGRGSVIGAGSVVNKSVPAGCLAVGNPCRVVRRLK